MTNLDSSFQILVAERYCGLYLAPKQFFDHKSLSIAFWTGVLMNYVMVSPNVEAINIFVFYLIMESHGRPADQVAALGHSH